MAIHTTADPELIPAVEQAQANLMQLLTLSALCRNATAVQSYYIAAGNEGFILKVKNWESQ